MEKTFVQGEIYKTVREVTAKIGTSFYIIPKGQTLVFKGMVKRNKVSNWFVFSYWYQDVKLTEVGASNVQ